MHIHAQTKSIFTEKWPKLLIAAALAVATHLAWAAEAPAAQSMALTAKMPLTLPQTELVYEAIVDIAPAMMLGEGPIGERRMVPITGGSFSGPGLRGTVLAGGADRQLVRKDGVKRLDAFYEMQTDDGAMLTIRNQVLVDQPKDGQRYAFSNVEITAPEGKYGWLNRAIYVGTLDSLRPERQAVLVRVYRVK